MKPSRLVTSGGVRRHTEPFGRAGGRDGRLHQHHPATPVTASGLPPGRIVVGHYRHEEDKEDEQHG